MVVRAYLRLVVDQPLEGACVGPAGSACKRSHPKELFTDYGVYLTN
jgi:hypothetical protein